MYCWQPAALAAGSAGLRPLKPTLDHCCRSPAGVLPSVVLAWTLLYCRLRWAHRVALKYREALFCKQQVVHKFVDELEVEVRGGRGPRGRGAGRGGGAYAQVGAACRRWCTW